MFHTACTKAATKKMEPMSYSHNAALSGGMSPVVYYSRILKLLDNNADIASFDHLVEEVRTEFNDPNFTEAFAADVVTASRLHDSFEQGRKRESEVVELYEAARHIAAQRDIGAMSLELCYRAKKFVKSGLSFLCLFDERTNEFYVHTSQGVISQEISILRIPKHNRISDHMQKKRALLFMGNYQNNIDSNKNDNFENVMRAEGIVTLLGIPLEASSGILGILFLADRYARTFTPQEVASLSSFATFATVIFENVKVLENHNRTLCTLAEENVALSCRARAVENSAVAFETLARLAALGTPLTELAEQIGVMSQSEICIVDERFEPVVGSLSSEVDKAVLSSAVRLSDKAGHSVVIEGSGGSTKRVAAIRSGPSRIGALISISATELSLEQVQIIERGVIIVGTVLLSLTRVAQSALGNVTDVLGILIRGASDPLELGGAKHMLSQHAIVWPITMLLVDPGELPPFEAASVVREILPGREHIVAEFKENVIIISNAINSETLAKRIAESFDDISIKRPNIVISNLVATAELIPSEYRVLRQSLKLLKNIGTHGRIIFAKSLSMYGALFDGKSADELRYFIRTSIGVVLDHDAKRKGHLAETMLAFLDSGKNMQKTGNMLDIHVNTVRQRLDLIGQIMPDWLELSRLLYIHVALRMQILLALGIGGDA